MERELAPQSAGQERVAVGRGLNTILTLPHDSAAIRQFLTMLLERLDETSEPAIQGLVLAADVETVIAIGRVAASMDRPSYATLLAVPSPRRGIRALRAGLPALLIVTPDDLLALLRESAVKLGSVRAVVFAWGEDLVAASDAALATVVAELPKEASRVLVASRLTPDVEAFAERYVRRIARAAPTPAEALRAQISFVTVGSGAKPSALRRVLDTLDPEAATVYVRTAEDARDARAELAGMGAAAAGISVVTEPRPIEDPLLVLYELPASAAELKTLAATESVKQVVALVRSRELPLFRALSGTAPRPLPLAGPTDRARAREAASRDELRALLADGVPARELLMLEPLLEEYDGVEVAAAALRLLEREREHRPRPASPPPAAAAPAEAAAAPPAQPGPTAPAASAAPGRTVRVFVNAGSRDGAAPRDFVGAIANVGGVPADRIGKVEVRDNHTLVELSAADAELVVEKLAGATIRGRRIAPRLDRERGPGERETRGPSDRSSRGPSDRSSRGPSDRSSRGPSDRSSRGPGERGSRGPGDRGTRGPRGAAPSRDRPPARGRSSGRPSERTGSSRPDRKPAPRGRRPS